MYICIYAYVYEYMYIYICIGNEEMGGLATEQRKRVTIVVEMAANPSL